MKKSFRTHDKFYLFENFKKNPKESFKFILNKVKGNLNQKNVLDIGCSNGDFLYYISQNFSNSRLYGLDIDKKLLKKTINEVPKIIKVYKKDISKKIQLKEKFDYIFMSGVHSIFDNCDIWFLNIQKMLRNKKSRVYIFGIWNDDDIDVLVRMKKTDKNSEWEKGWNIISKKTIKKLIFKYKLKHKFHEFKLNINLEKNKSDLFRTWSIKIDNNKNLIVNGGCILHKFYLLEIFY